MEYIDYYRELGVSKTSSKEEIQRAYRKLARKYHPDINKEPGAEDKFKRIAEAYEVLKDPDKRKKYDRFGAAWNKAGPAGGGGAGGRRRGAPFEGVNFDPHYRGGARGAAGFSSFFEQLFGKNGFPGGFSSSGSFHEEVVTKGRDQDVELTLSLEDAAKGGARKITLSDGQGSTRTLEVNLPPGVMPGQRIRLKAQGSPGVGGGEAGDLYLVLAIEPHPRFRLEGADLHAELEVPAWVAALGGEAALFTLDGQVTLTIPAGSSSGRKIRLRGKGYPRSGGERGDLYAIVKVLVPKSLTEREKELWEELRALAKPA